MDEKADDEDRGLDRLPSKGQYEGQPDTTKIQSQLRWPLAEAEAEAEEPRTQGGPVRSMEEESR